MGRGPGGRGCGSALAWNSGCTLGPRTMPLRWEEGTGGRGSGRGPGRSLSRGQGSGDREEQGGGCGRQRAGSRGQGIRRRQGALEREWDQSAPPLLRTRSLSLCIHGTTHPRYPPYPFAVRHLWRLPAADLSSHPQPASPFALTARPTIAPLYGAPHLHSARQLERLSAADHPFCTPASPSGSPTAVPARKIPPSAALTSPPRS